VSGAVGPQYFLEQAVVEEALLLRTFADAAQESEARPDPAAAVQADEEGCE
jgi:hypothetical protein